MSGLRPRSRPQVLRLTLTVALVAGAAVLVVVLAKGGGHGSRSTPPPLPIETVHGVAPSQASNAALAHTLQHGQMIVVIDQPSSGLFAEQNASIAKGAAVAVDELNTTGGLVGHVRVKLVPEDLDGLSAAEVEGRLRSAAAAALILPCDTDSQLSLAAEAAKYKTLMLAPCNMDPTAGRRYSTYWPVGMSASDEAAGLVAFMHQSSYGSAFIVTAPGSRYVELLTRYFRATAKRGGIRIVGSASISLTTRDFSSLASTIAAANPAPTIIFTALPPPLVNQMAAGLKARGVTQSVVGASSMDTRLSLTSNPGALDEAVFTSYGFRRERAPAVRRFVADYKRLFAGQPVGSFSDLGFETIRLLEDAVRQARSAEPKAVQQALSGGIALSGVALAERSYPRGGDHNPVGRVGIEKIVEGRLEPLLAITPEQLSVMG